MKKKRFLASFILSGTQSNVFKISKIFVLLCVERKNEKKRILLQKLKKKII